MTNGGLNDLDNAQNHFHPEAESDADEEVRSLDLPGIEMTKHLLKTNFKKQHLFLQHK